MPANKMPEMPEYLDSLSGSQRYLASEYGHACYLAGIADARAVVESSERYEASIGGGCECCGTWVDIDPDKHGDLLRRKETLTNLTALEQEAKK